MYHLREDSRDQSELLRQKDDELRNLSQRMEEATKDKDDSALEALVEQEKSRSYEFKRTIQQQEQELLEMKRKIQSYAEFLQRKDYPVEQRELAMLQNELANY